MTAITEREFSAITDTCITGSALVTKVISGINEICNNIGIAPLDKNLSSSGGYNVFTTCESKPEEILLTLGTRYPSDEAVVGQLPFGNFPKLPTFRDIGRGTETNIQASGVVGFAFGLVGFGISKAIQAAKKAELRKKNRITNFVLVYNSLASQLGD